MTNSILDREFDSILFRVRGKIYVLRNEKTGEEYIGATATSISTRMRHHIESCRRKKKNYPLYLAMRQYGHKSFKIEQIASCISLDELNLLETEIILDRKPAYNRRLHSDNIWS